MTAEQNQNLPNYSLFAAMLAMAGLPIYIFAPKFYVDEYGVSLAALGTTLFLLRFLDFIQDPSLGWISDKIGSFRKVGVIVATALMMLAMTGLFVINPLIKPIVWFGITMAILFSGFSFLTVSFYALGSEKADELGLNGHERVATWREAGALLGVCIACIVPFALTALLPNFEPFTGFTIMFGVVCVLAVFLMHKEWGIKTRSYEAVSASIFNSTIARKLLVITILNAAPVAVTSSLFLFFVESRLGAANAAGPLLLLFFFSAAISVPLWSAVARRLGTKATLMVGMILSIIAFGFAFRLETGQLTQFAFICALSGVTLGADMLLLPALFSKHVAAVTENTGQAFGLWSFCSKLTLAIAAVTVLPLLELVGFQSGQENSPAALQRLSQLYALVPCALKLVAFGMLYFTVLEET